MLHSMGSQRFGHDLATETKQVEILNLIYYFWNLYNTFISNFPRWFYYQDLLCSLSLLLVVIVQVSFFCAFLIYLAC